MNHAAAPADLPLTNPGNASHERVRIRTEAGDLLVELYADRAPTPDPSVLAMVEPSAAAEPTEVGPQRRVRSADPMTPSSATMAADGVGLVELGGGPSFAAGTRPSTEGSAEPNDPTASGPREIATG